MKNLLKEAAIWIDPSDKHTWFKDEACTVPATQPHDVKWLKNKAMGEPQSLSVGKLSCKKHGTYFMEGVQAKSMRISTAGALRGPLLMQNKAESKEVLKELERKFIRDLQIQPRATSALTYEDKNG